MAISTFEFSKRSRLLGLDRDMEESVFKEVKNLIRNEITIKLFPYNVSSLGNTRLNPTSLSNCFDSEPRSQCSYPATSSLQLQTLAH